MNKCDIDNRVKWQIDCDNVIKEKDNVILSSPTGSGKTGRYENWALNKPERPIFITSPIKALSNQRFRQLQAKGYKVGLETGDTKYIPNDDCDIICCTQEIYNRKYMNYRNCTLIIDEFSYVFDDDDRARIYIDSLYYSLAKNIMICSATFGNSQEIREYINKVTNREFFLYENQDRLTSLEYIGELKRNNIKDSFVVTYSSINCRKIAKCIYNDRILKIQQLLNRSCYGYYDPREKYKKEILNLAKKYDIDNQELIELSTIGVTYYFGRLYPKEKLFIEALFERRLIDTVVGTDALALGVNFPIKNVVFTELKKNNKIISKNLFEQISGRAGRKGFFDNGYVYYSNDFNNNKLGYDFFNLVNAKKEKATISLCPDIKYILMGDTTIENEAKFITKYSTASKSIEDEMENINNTIDFITSFNIVSYCLKNIFPNLNLEQEYYKIIDELTEEQRIQFEKLSNSLMHLQSYFQKDIGLVYMPEYSSKQNCIIFIDILLEISIENLVKKYVKEFRDILLLRKYIYQLPKQYSKNYDLSIIDEMIDNMDYTVLHPEKIPTDDAFNHRKVEPISKKTKKIIYKCPSFFDKILIEGKEYIKILTVGNNILVCDCSNDNNLNLSHIPINTRYKIVAFIKDNEILDILNRLNLDTLKIKDEKIDDKIEGMKLYLKQKCKTSKKR